jgi:hypothetical protein
MFKTQSTPRNDIFCRSRMSQIVLLQGFANGKGLPTRENSGRQDTKSLQMKLLALKRGPQGKLFQVGTSRAYFPSVLWHYLHSLKEIS